MKLTLKPLIAAVLIAAAHFSGAAFARSASAPDGTQRHFTTAIEDYAKKDYKAAADEIRTASVELRKEAGRASGEARQALETSIAQLDKLAASVEKGALEAAKSMRADFARANHALAIEHRARAAESWGRRQYQQAGHELKAAAQSLESAAAWAGAEAQAAARSSVAQNRALGDKLASGASWARDEVARAFQGLGNDINALSQKIGSGKRASPFDVGT
jgi:hypothetical protein